MSAGRAARRILWVLLCAAMVSGTALAGRKVDGYAEKRVTEALGRGVVAVRRPDGGIYVGWRLLDSDGSDVGFNVYRSRGDERWRRLNEEPIRTTTDYLDETAEDGTTYRYRVRPVTGDGEGAPSRAVAPLNRSSNGAYLSIPLKGDYAAQKVGIGDLNGDGRYDYVIKQPDTNIDPWFKAWHPSEGTYKVEAYRHDGTFLWRKDLGWAIERGIWYSPMLVYDFNGDGKAEVALKTGEGDPRIKEENPEDPPLHVAGGDPVYKGKVMSGPEHVSVLNGMTGETMSRADWPSREGYRNYNLTCRNQMCVAYLDGRTPCLVVERGTYGTIKLDAYELRGGSLRKLWHWDNRDEPERYRGQGAHSMHAADVDDDGRDEVFIGSAVVDDTGESLWATGLGHPDHHYVSDIMPERPGLEVYYGLEGPNMTASPKKNSMCVADARTGDILWGLDERTWHVHSSGLCSDILAEHKGMECYGLDREDPEGREARLFSAQGELISQRDMGFRPRAAWWDADPQRELLLDGRLQDFDGTKKSAHLEGDFVASADVVGDWREELIMGLPGELRIYTTTIPAADRHVCLMQDSLYRLDVAVAAMGYTQVPMTSYYMAGQ